MIAGNAHYQPLPFISGQEKTLFLIVDCFPWQDHLVEDRQTYIPEIGPLVAITISPDHQGDGVEALDGEIAHPEEDHVLPMVENETGTGIEKETEVEIVKERGSGTKIESLTGTVSGKEVEEVTGRLKKEVTGYQFRERKL